MVLFYRPVPEQLVLCFYSNPLCFGNRNLWQRDGVNPFTQGSVRVS